MIKKGLCQKSETPQKFHSASSHTWLVSLQNTCNGTSNTILKPRERRWIEIKNENWYINDTSRDEQEDEWSRRIERKRTKTIFYGFMEVFTWFVGSSWVVSSFLSYKTGCILLSYSIWKSIRQSVLPGQPAETQIKGKSSDLKHDDQKAVYCMQ